MSPYSNVSTDPGTIGEALVARFRKAIHYSHEIALNSEVNFEIPETKEPEKQKRLKESEIEGLTSLLEEARDTLGRECCVTQIPGYITLAVALDRQLRRPNYVNAKKELKEAIRRYKAKIQEGNHIL